MILLWQLCLHLKLAYVGWFCVALAASSFDCHSLLLLNSLKYLPVTRRRPVANCLRITTLFPLWMPAKTMAMTPGAKLALNERVCLLKKFLEVPGSGLKLKKRNTKY